jgi:hypothetical protein
MTTSNPPPVAATSGNRSRMARIERALAELLAEALRRGFYGRASLEVTVQDGTIQHIRRLVERLER